MDKHTHHAEHTDELKRLKKIEGQVRGVAKMIEDEKYCIDILIQVKAIKSALGQLEIKIMEKHLKHCLHGALNARDSKEVSDKIQEIVELLGKRT